MSRMNRSALDHLRILPALFTLQSAAAVLNVEPRVASIYLKRWRDAGLISSLSDPKEGQRTGIHFNLVLNPDAAREHRADAIALLYPRAVIGGASAVHAAGWTTQIPRALEILIPTTRTIVEIPDVAISTRSQAWFRKFHGSFQSNGALPRLEPAFALADAWAKRTWRPDPDELEWDLVDAAALRAAFADVGCEIPEDWLEELEDGGPAQAGLR